MNLLGEIAARWRSLRPSTPADPVADFPPTDGIVGIQPVRGVRSRPNEKDSRFGLFMAIDPIAEAANPVRRRGRRKLPPLLGRVVLTSLFLDCDAVAWSEQEIARAHDAMMRAGNWVEREAMRLKAPVHLDLADTYFVAESRVDEGEVALVKLPEGSGDGLFDNEAEVKLVAAASRAASALGFADVADLADKIGRRVEADSKVWMIHPRSAGRSFVVTEAETWMPGLNLAICYAREANFPGSFHGPAFSDPVTFAHELLHLFGATDKYNIPLHQFPRGSVTERDIMRLEFEGLSRLRIDPGTANEIGWGDARRA